MNTEKSYEFDSAQNETIHTLAKTLQFVGMVTMVFALVFALGCLRAMTQSEWPEVISQGMVMVFTFAMGSLMIKAGKAFQAIVATAGEDITHLMAALDNLRQMYSILSVIIIISILLTLVALALSLVSSNGPAVV